MRQPHYYSNMPPNHPSHYPNQIHQFGYQAPPPYPPRPHGYPGPNPAPRLDSFMEAANKLISTYQSFQPIIAQATPMLKNLPALWKLYKGFQNVPKQGENKHNPYRQPKKEEREFQYREPIESRSYSRRESRQYGRYEDNKKGVSLPRIYQPPFHF